MKALHKCITVWIEGQWEWALSAAYFCSFFCPLIHLWLIDECMIIFFLFPKNTEMTAKHLTWLDLNYATFFTSCVYISGVRHFLCELSGSSDHRLWAEHPDKSMSSWHIFLRYICTKQSACKLFNDTRSLWGRFFLKQPTAALTSL